MSQALTNLRSDLSIIQQWVKPNSQVLDLGCGHGELLSFLKTEKNEIDIFVRFVKWNLAHFLLKSAFSLLKTVQKYPFLYLFNTLNK